jgi:single-strand DNA-binding protein
MLIGNLGADPEVRSIANGNKVVNLSIATSDTWKDKDTGQKKERTEWHRVVIWNEGLGGIAEKYLRKGDKVYIEGELQTRSWEDQEGVKRYSTEVVLSGFGGELRMLSTKRGVEDSNDNASRPGNGSGAAPGRRPGANRGGPSPAFESAGLDDDIPF